MTNPEPPLSDVVIEHYGVKGMKWGQRKRTIKEARRTVGTKARATSKAEQEFLETREAGKDTSQAYKKLNDAHRKEEANARTAMTMTRGEQVLTSIIGLPLSGVGGVAAVGINAGLTRDSKPIKDYPISVLDGAVSDKSLDD